MSLTDESNGLIMPVSPMYGGGNGGFGGGFGNDWGWIILLLLFAGGGWGNGFGGFGGGGALAADGAMLYPWMNQSQQVNDGFRDQMLNSAVTGIQSAVTSGFGDVQTALCGGFAGVNASINNGFAQAEIAENSRQMANMNQMYGISTQLSNCCCENRLQTVETRNAVATEGAATRLAIQEQTQAILDKMCQQEIDALKAQNLELQNRVNMQALAASQVQQTAALIADNTAQTQYIVNRVAPYPIPAYIVANPVTPSA